MKKFFILCNICFFFLIISFVVKPYSVDAMSFEIVPEEIEIKPGKEFSIDLYLDSDEEEIRTGDINLFFDTNYLEFVDYENDINGYTVMDNARDFDHNQIDLPINFKTLYIGIVSFGNPTRRFDEVIGTATFKVKDSVDFGNNNSIDAQILVEEEYEVSGLDTTAFYSPNDLFNSLNIGLNGTDVTIFEQYVAWTILEDEFEIVSGQEVLYPIKLSSNYKNISSGEIAISYSSDLFDVIGFEYDNEKFGDYAFLGGSPEDGMYKIGFMYSSSDGNMIDMDYEDIIYLRIKAKDGIENVTTSEIRLDQEPSSQSITGTNLYDEDLEEFRFASKDFGNITINPSSTGNDGGGSNNNGGNNTNDNGFTDLDGGILDQYVINLENDGVIDGYDDGTYRPNNPVTRGEFSKFIVNGLGIELDLSGDQFDDINSNHTFFDYIQTLKNSELSSGYGDNTYRADNYLTREEASKILVLALEHKLGRELDYNETNFPDVASDNKFIEYIMKISSNEVDDKSIMNGYSNGKFGSNDQLTRGQMAKIVDLGRQLQ